MRLQEALERANALGAKGAFFEAHEELEARWMTAAGPEKLLLQGLIQVCAGLHRLKLDPAKPDGAFYLLDKGGEKLRASAALLEPAPLAALVTTLKKIKASGKAPEALSFGLRVF